jgi:hypothetical protein
MKILLSFRHNLGTNPLVDDFFGLGELEFFAAIAAR